MQARSPPAVLRVVLPLAVAAQAARLGADGYALTLAGAADLHRQRGEGGGQVKQGRAAASGKRQAAAEAGAGAGAGLGAYDHTCEATRALRSSPRPSWCCLGLALLPARAPWPPGWR